MSKFVIEMGWDSPTYGKVHREGCRNGKDPEPVGDTIREIMECWPWPEEADEAWVKCNIMLCAKELLR